MDSCRPHYAATWPPVLHAAALWLNTTGFNDNDDNASNTASDKFHLLFGICMEALCSPRMSEPLESVIICLRALYTLLDTPEPRAMLLVDKSLAIELCNVLHRLLLTRDSPEAHLLVMEVLKQVMKAAQESLDSLKKKKLKEMAPANQQEALVREEADLLGEGGATGDLVGGASLTFALLEVCLCLLVRQLPALNPAPGAAPAAAHRPRHDASQQLIAAALTTMQMLPKLCSPLGAISILPTVLYLTTGVLKECALKAAAVAADTQLATQAALHCLKVLATDRHAHHAQWRLLLQSALAKLIDLVKTGSDDKKMDEVTMMLAITVFVLHTPAEVVSAPNLQYPCINHFRQSLQSENIQVRVKCVQTLRSIFSHSEKTVSTGYIHALAPRIVEYLHSEAARNPTSDAELLLTLESIYTIESLVPLAEPKHRDVMQGIQMLSMLVPIVIDCLLEGPALKEANRFCRSLHEQALQVLMKIGPQYPQEFKALISQSSEMRTRLEAAIRNSQQQQRAKAELTTTKPVASAVPTIKLKTDFRNFTT
ncbi:hypothetical protein LSTR_LSTR014265 [Laodelphax striatellus]|uniref:HEAT repeat-containing protein 5B n=1 Tax=Laodelphax striatellus TaxID=195883 RepID=A0A482WPR7_LAOST|nr:hypothetical protein LSTR_LSTR014265 [Laodelphax striatellus]